MEIYTDVSKDDCKLDAFVFEHHFTPEISQPDNESIFTAAAKP
jgi:hypothetical protein